MQGNAIGQLRVIGMRVRTARHSKDSAMAEPVLLAVPADQMTPRPDDAPHDLESQSPRELTADRPSKGRQPLFRR